MKATLARWSRRSSVVLPAALVVLVGLATGLGLAFGITIATFVVVVYSAIFSGVTFLGWKPFQARPELSIALRIGVETVTAVQLSSKPYASIDEEACVAHHLSIARGSVTPPPKTHPYLGLEIGLESYDTALARFNTELAEYAVELRGWLEAFESRRWPNYSLLRALVAITNRGESVARGVTLRLALPEGIVPITDEDQLSIAAPPSPPRFEQKNLALLNLETYRPIVSPASLPKIKLPMAPSAISGPDLFRERDHVIVQFRIETLTHGVTEVSQRPFVAMPTRPGNFQLGWEAHVENLRQPARGALDIRVDERPAEEFKLTTVAAVVNSKDVPVLDD
jgi:hypothetical protein